MGNTGARGGSVEQHVDQARKTGACSLKDHKLTHVPELVVTLKGSLRTLDLSVNKLSTLPPSLGEFTLLKSLNLSSNRLSDLPDLSQLKKLETLTVDHNSLPSLPDNFSNLKALKSINLSHNLLTTFPLCLSQLPHLGFIDVSNNQIAELPESAIEGLKVVELNLNNNSISVLPEALSRCQRLKVLRVEENTLELGGIPPSLLTSSTISLLCVAGNMFQMREFEDMPEYQQYMERYTATKKKAD